MSDAIRELLIRACDAYEMGTPFMSDTVYDSLSITYKQDNFGGEVIGPKVTHLYPLYSLQKKFDDESDPSDIRGHVSIETPKLDGAAIALVYEKGILVQAGTRGRDGIEGEDITDKAWAMNSIPNTFWEAAEMVQVRGEIVCSKKIENARNFCAGALRTKSLKEFVDEKESHLIFVAYGVEPFITPKYNLDMLFLEKEGFDVVINEYCKEFFRTDGTVYRIDDNAIFKSLGYTAKHPRGAYARKKSSDVEIKETTLNNVVWQVGSSGKVTPVAEFDTITIDDANINRATLHNPGFIEEMDLDIGDTILVTRSGGIIPKVIGKV